MKHLNKILLIPLITLCSCANGSNNIETVNDAISVKFIIDYPEDTEIIKLHTIQDDIYYFTDLYYRVIFSNNINLLKYISSYNSSGKLDIREITNE